MATTSTCRTATRPFWETARSATSKKAESRLQLRRGFPEASRRDFDFSNSTIICTSRVPVFSLVLAIVSLILVNRSFSSSLIAALRRPKPTLWWILLVIGTIMAASLLVPWLRELFRFDALHRDDLVLAFGLGLSVLVLLELAKPLRRKSPRF